MTDNKNISEVLKELNEKLETYMESPLEFKSALINLARFENISINNRVFLIQQLNERGLDGHYPVFKTFNDWKKENVTIKKGAKAYSIFVPNKVSAGIVKDENENEIEEFRIKYSVRNIYFHLSDTNSELNIKQVNDDIKYLKSSNNNLFNNIVAELGLNIQEENSSMYDGKIDNNKNIYVNSALNDNTKLNVLFHELAHDELNHLEELNKPIFIKELEAESVSFLVSHYFGLDDESSSIRYLSSYSKDDIKLQNLFSNILKGYDNVLEKYGTQIENAINKTVELENEYYFNLETH